MLVDRDYATIACDGKIGSQFMRFRRHPLIRIIQTRYSPQLNESCELYFGIC
jgi:hypothetical protein